MHHIDDEVHDYIAGLIDAAQSDDLFGEMEARAEAESFHIVGRTEGRLLELATRMVGGRRVFELGSGYGYSAFFFARAVGPNGRVVCTEERADLVVDAEGYLTRAGLWNRVEYRLGDALELLAQSDEIFDVVYVDTHKFQYPEAWNLARSRIRVGGLYVCDNALWRGMVPREEDDLQYPGWPKAIREHNDMVFSDPDWVAHLDPTRDGVIVALRMA